MTDHGFEGTREEVRRAIRRLHILEYLILVAVVVLALGGGGFAAYVLSTGTDLPFRLTWAVISLVLIVVPGFVVFGKERLGQRADPGASGEGPSDGR